MDELLNDFLAETDEALAAIEGALVRFEREPGDRATLDAVFRLVHTVKGGCGFLDLPRLEALAHAAETVLGRLRDGSLTTSTHVVSGVLTAMDALKAITAALSAGGTEPEGDDAGLVRHLERLAAGETPDAEPVAEGEAGDAYAQQTIRVPLQLIEQLMDTVSELVLTRNQLLQIARADGRDEALGVYLQRLSQCITSIQDGVMRTRMQPIERVWATLPRMVRRLGLDLGKKINVHLTGGDVELDRQMIEVIKEPLQHMVRNAADHGLETPDRRRRAGKGETGHIRIGATQEGGQIVVRFEDDGQGLDLLALRAKAAANGLMSEAAALRLTNSEAARLIFHAGLSTSDTVTSISGRGVGMDVVRANLEKIGGSVEVETAHGHGTAFTLRIPLTLAIVPALVVEAAKQRFAIPQVGVLELVEAGGDNPIEWVHEAPVLRLRGKLLPLVDAAVALGLERGTPRFVVVAQAEGFRYGLLVDELFDTEEIVVKPVAPLLADLEPYCGNTVLADGAATLILDVAGLARLAGLEAGAVAADNDPPDALETTRPMLLFDAGDGAQLAVPLEHVERIEDLGAGAVEQVGGRAILQYRGGLLPVVGLDGRPRVGGGHVLLVLNDGETTGGLAIRAVADIVGGDVRIEPGGAEYRLGNTVIGGRIVEVIDARAYIALARRAAPRLERAA